VVTNANGNGLDEGGVMIGASADARRKSIQDPTRSWLQAKVALTVICKTNIVAV
jgi:hypothetical protein